MERCIKDAYHRCVRHQFLTGRDTQKIWRIMQRSQFDTVFQSLDNSIVDQYGVCELFAGVYNTMSYCSYFTHIFNNAVILILDRHQNVRNSILVVCHRYDQLELVASRFLMCNHRSLHADSFDQTLAKQRFVSHIENLIL